MKHISLQSGFLLLLLLLASCNYFKDKTEIQPDQDSYFEGEIEITETQGLWGEVYKVNTTYLISENRLKREQIMGGVNRLLNIYAGVIIDLATDTVLLYYSNPLNDIKIQHRLSVKSYRAYLQAGSMPITLPSPVENAFTWIKKPELVTHVKDSLKMKGLHTNYSLYKDSGMIKIETFDTKEIKIRRELLKMTFINIPEGLNFPLKTEVKTIASDIDIDSLQVDSSLNKEIDIEQLSKNKWIRKSFKVLKKGVDLAIRVTTQISAISKRKITVAEFFLPKGEFVEIPDFDEFTTIVTSNNGQESDD